MRSFLPFAIFAFALALSPAASARDCSDASSQKEMTDCAKQNYDKSDATLNANYALLKQRLKNDADTTKLLVGAQRNWLKFRDSECKFSVSSVEGGSFYNYAYLQCLKRLTQTRVRDFKAYLNCQEGDLSCPAP